MTATDRQDDRLGALIRAAGRRPSPSDEDAARLLSAARSAWQMKVRARRRRQSLFASAASVAAVAALGAVLHGWLEPPPPAAMLVRVIGDVELRVPGEEAWRPLDGTEAVIGPGTVVRTLEDGRVSFDMSRASLRVDGNTEIVLESQDRVTLRGGALYYDSGGNRRDSVEIATAFGVVRDVGTQFEIRASESELRLRVREGQVQLEARAVAGNLSSTAGEEVTLTADGEVQRRAFPRVHDAWAWVEALAESPELNGRSAYDVLAWAARETGRRLVFADPAAELRARTTILAGRGPRVALTPMEAVEVAVATADGLGYSLSDGELVVGGR